MTPNRTFPAAIFGSLFLFAACGGTDQPATPPIIVDTTQATLIDGPQIVHTKDGGRMEGEVQDTKRNGPWSSFFANGGIRSKAIYVHGLEEGPTEVFHENGMTYYAGQYHVGKPVGEWLFYNAQGMKVKTVRYDSLGVMLDQR